MEHYTTPQELTALHDRGVHFVLCRSTDEGKRKAKSALGPVNTNLEKLLCW